jgi:two-component system OmpR family sensor kinase
VFTSWISRPIVTKVKIPLQLECEFESVTMSSAEASPNGSSSPMADSREELLARIEQLTAAVAARDTFIAVAAHELRNPMMPILGQLDLLISGIRNGKLSLELVEQRLARVQQTVHQFMKRAVVLLDVSRINSGRFRLEPIPCDLASLLRQIADEFTAAAQHSGVTLTVAAPDNVPGLWDRLAVEQVVDNLVSNAIKYGGRSPVELGLIEDEEVVHLHVRDHGKGVPREHRGRIFDQFERAVGHDEYRSGFGVGLWVVGQLVEAMKGTITIDDAPGGGALFSVKLPKCSAGESK